MKTLNEKELKSIEGGGWGAIAGIIAGITFIIGVIDGYVNPSKCN